MTYPLNQNAPNAPYSWPGYGRRPASHRRKAKPAQKGRDAVPGQDDSTLIAYGRVLGGVGGYPGVPVVLSVRGAGLLERRFSHLLPTPTQWDHLWLFLHIVEERLAVYQDDEEEFVGIGARQLEGLMGRDAYSWAKATLLAAGVLECDDRYEFNSKDAKCLGYRWGNEFEALPPEERVLSDLQGKLYRERRRKRAEIRTAGGAIVYANLRRLTLHPDHEAAVPDFDTMLAEIATENLEDDRQRRKSIWSRRNAWHRSIREVQSSPFPFKESGLTGRVYSGFSSQPKRLRGYALLDGAKTAEVDIRNSQPLLLAGLYPAGSEEKQRYARIVERGKFYEYLMKAAGKPITSETREAFKADAYAVFFGQDRFSPEMLEIWRAAFPELAELIVEHKAADYRLLSWDLQRIEAIIMIESVVPRLAEELPGVPVLTVHDSLVLPQEHAHAAAKVIREEVERFTGLTPALRITLSAVLA